MRDGDGDISSRTIALQEIPNPWRAATLFAKVYGAEKQPYITEMLIQYEPNGGNPYAAMEIYNPHPTPIIVNNWKLAQITRLGGNNVPYATGPQGGIRLTEFCDLTTTFQKAGRPFPYRINPGERIVLQSQGVVPANIQASFAARTPPFKPMMVWAAGSKTPGIIYAANEIVLLRPRRADGTLTSCSDVGNIYNEVGNLYDLVPLDNIDLTGLTWNGNQPPPAPGMNVSRAAAIPICPGNQDHLRHRQRRLALRLSRSI